MLASISREFADLTDARLQDGLRKAAEARDGHGSGVCRTRGKRWAAGAVDSHSPRRRLPMSQTMTTI